MVNAESLDEPCNHRRTIGKHLEADGLAGILRSEQLRRLVFTGIRESTVLRNDNALKSRSSELLLSASRHRRSIMNLDADAHPTEIEIKSSRQKDPVGWNDNRRVMIT